MKAGALPAFCAARDEAGGGGSGLLRIAMYVERGRSAVYRSYTTDRGLPRRPDAPGAGEDDVERFKMRRSSACSRGMKPGSIGVPPITSIEDARDFRRSTGTCGEGRPGQSRLNPE